MLELLCELVTLLNLLGDAGRGSTDAHARNDGASKGGLSRGAVILVEELLVILDGHLACLDLGVDGRCVVLGTRSEFSRTGSNINAAATTVVADAVYDPAAVANIVVDHVVAVDVMDDVDVDVGHSAVVVEVMILPVAAEVADTDVAEAVVDAAVEADVGPPVAVMEGVTAAVVTPVRRRPEGTVVGRWAPRAGDPVITGVGVTPVTGRPEVVGFGSGRLVVLRKRRWGLIGVECLVVGFGS